MLDLLLCWRLTVQYARHIFIQRQTHTHERADERILEEGMGGRGIYRLIIFTVHLDYSHLCV
jgi:hypothetical protein